jgi:DNA-directed RNA polymerase subunit K/omega
MTDIQRPTFRPANSFEFVTIAALRARQLLEGCVPRVEGSAKPARRALQEVLQGAVTRADQASDEPVQPGVEQAESGQTAADQAVQ